MLIYVWFTTVYHIVMDIPHWAHRRMKMCKHRMAFRIELKLTGGLMLSTQWLWNCSIWFWHTFHLHLCRSASESLVKCFIPIPWMQLCSPAGQRTFPVHAGCTKAGGPDMLFPLIYCHLMSLVKWKFPEIGLRPVIIHFNAIFPYKPSILGYPHLWKVPNLGPYWLSIFWWIMARGEKNSNLTMYFSSFLPNTWSIMEPSVDCGVGQKSSEICPRHLGAPGNFGSLRQLSSGDSARSIGDWWTKTEAKWLV